MKTRIAGVVLIAFGVIVAVLFVYFPARDGGLGHLGVVRLKALVFAPLAVVSGLAFLVGGPRALGAFQARPKSRGQLAFVLGVIVGSAVLSGLGYWQLRTRWVPASKQQIIRDFRPQVPQVDVQPPSVPRVSQPADRN